MFWYRWNSWVVEILGGAALAAVALLAAAGSVAWAGVLCVVLSLYYESCIDVNGWSLKDVAQRQVGILAGLLLWQFIR